LFVVLESVNMVRPLERGFAMRVICVSIAILVMLSSAALAQANYRLEFYADEGLSSCELAMTTAGLVKVHMLVTGHGHLAAMSFKAVKPPCMGNAVWIADIWQGLAAYYGNTQATAGSNGVDVVFECAPLPRYVGWIWFSISEPAAPCCMYGPSPGSWGGRITFPGYMELDIWDTCTPAPDGLAAVPMSGKGLVVNANATCACNGPVAVQPTTWGSVKALYR
jgi:hypothetical protein